MATRGKIDEITREDVRQSAHKLQDIADSMNTAKTPEQKKLEDALAVTEDKATREFLQSRIADISNGDIPAMSEVVTSTEALGYNPVDVLRGGVTKRKQETDNAELKDSLDELVKAMATDKTPEQRKLEAAIEATEDTEVKAFLQERVKAIESNSGMSFEEAIDTLEDLGVSAYDTFRSGILKKVSNLITWNRNKNK